MTRKASINKLCKSFLKPNNQRYCAPFSNKCKTTWSRTHGALYSTIVEGDWGIDARKGEGVQE